MSERQTFRFLSAGVGCSIALTKLLLIVTSSAIAEQEAQTAEVFNPPNLLSLTWQEDDPRQITKLFLVRQKHAAKTFKDLLIKRDLLFKELQKNESDE